MRRIGIITFEYPDKGEQRMTYGWDFKNLAQLRAYAVYISDWTAANIVELLWCDAAEAHYFRDKLVNQRWMFSMYDKAEKDKNALPGNALADAWTLEQSAVLYFRQSVDGVKGCRRVSWPAPVQHLFLDDGALDPNVGDIMAFALRQATGIASIQFSSGRLMHFVREQEDRV